MQCRTTKKQLALLIISLLHLHRQYVKVCILKGDLKRIFSSHLPLYLSLFSFFFTAPNFLPLVRYNMKLSSKPVEWGGEKV